MNNNEFQRILKELGCGVLLYDPLARLLVEELAPQPELRKPLLGHLASKNQETFRKDAGWPEEDFEDPDACRGLIRDLLPLWEKIQSGKIQDHGRLLYALAPFAHRFHRPAVEQEYGEHMRAEPQIRKFGWDALPALLKLCEQFKLIVPDPELPTVWEGAPGFFLILRAIAPVRIDISEHIQLCRQWALWQASSAEKLFKRVDKRESGAYDLAKRLLPDFLKAHDDLLNDRPPGYSVSLARLILNFVHYQVEDEREVCVRVRGALLRAVDPPAPQQAVAEARDGVVVKLREEQANYAEAPERIAALDRLLHWHDQPFSKRYWKHLAQKGGLQLLNEDTRAAGEENLRRCFANWPRDPEPMSMLGDYYREQDRLEDAAWALELAAGAEQSQYRIFYLGRLADVLYRLGRYEKAQEVWQEAWQFHRRRMPQFLPWDIGLRLQLREGQSAGDLLKRAQNVLARNSNLDRKRQLLCVVAELALQVGDRVLADEALTQAYRQNLDVDPKDPSGLRLIDRQVFQARFTAALDTLDDPAPDQAALGLVEIQAIAGIDFFHEKLFPRATEYLLNALRALTDENPEDIRQALLLRIARLHEFGCDSEEEQRDLTKNVALALDRSPEDIAQTFIHLLNPLEKH